jgi:hypothetical protein
MLGPDSLVMRDSAIFGADLAEETVLLSVDQGKYFSLSATSRAIWAGLSEAVRVKDLCANLARTYDAPIDQITKDTLAFLDYLQARGLILVVG